MAGILLIDDDVDRLDILAGMLRRAGYEVFASRPVDAAALHVNGQPSPGLAVAVMMARADRATAEASSTGAQAPAGPAAEAAAPAVATLPEGLTVHQFLARQSLVADRAALDTLRRLLAGGDGTTTVPTAVSTAVPTPFSTAVAAPLPATVRTAALTSRRA